MFRLTIWMNMPSFYQGALFKALSAHDEIDLEVVFARELPIDRINLGWDGGLDGFSYYFLDARNKVADAIRVAQSQRTRLHIVNGLWSELPFAVVLCTLAVCGGSFVIYSEAPDPNQTRSTLKKFLQRTFGSRMVPRSTGILCVSRRAEEFYKKLTRSTLKLYPFGYFRSAPDPQATVKRPKNDRVEIVFVGQLIHRKGIDLLLEALKPLFEKHQNLSLTIIGAGELLDSIDSATSSRALSTRVICEGVLPSDAIHARLVEADALVLPSRWDGWGMVVNESLSVGTPVIVSDHCGAADLIQHGVNGYVFRSEDVVDLRRCIEDFLCSEDKWTLLRSRATATGQSLSAETAADYLVDCLKHMTGELAEQPYPPWYPQRNSASTQAIQI